MKRAPSNNATLAAKFGATALVVASLLAISAGNAYVARGHEADRRFESTVTKIAPPVAGLSAEVVSGDDQLRLANRSKRDVIVAGYRGEPYLRFLADGTVSVNLRSPAHYENQERFGDVKLPVIADPKAAPRWRLLTKTGIHEWHDHRIHWMSKTDPGSVADRNERSMIFDWQVPLELTGDGVAARAKIYGELWWRGEGSTAAGSGTIWALAIVFGGLIAAAGAFLVIRRAG